MHSPKANHTTELIHGMRYRVLILCIWQDADATQPAWRFSLESHSSDDRRGFRSLDLLVAYLHGLLAVPRD